MATRQIKAEYWNSPVIRVPQINKESLANRSILQLTTPGQAIWHRRDYHAFAKEGYSENTEAFACINLLATAVKGIEFGVYKKQSGNKRVEVDKHPLLDLIQKPNRYQSGAGFFEGWIIYLMCAGNTFIERVGPSPTAPPRELHLQRPDRMYVIPQDPNRPELGLIAGYRYQTWYAEQIGKQNTWLPDPMKVTGIPGLVQKILHSKFFDPIDDWYGLSPLSVAARSVDQNNAAQEWNVSVLQNSGRPSGLLSVSGASPDQVRETEQRFNAKHSGTANVGKTIVTNGEDVKYVRISSTAAEMDWLKGQEMATRRICSVFKVPPELIGDSAQRTYSNFETARKAFYTEGVLPLCDFMVAELNMWLQPFFGDDIEIGYNEEDIEALQEDRSFVAERALNGLAHGGITRNMYLKALGQDALPPAIGDVFLVPTNCTQVGMDGKPLIEPVVQPIPGNDIKPNGSPVKPPVKPKPTTPPVKPN